jgi:hypothetical protein
MIINCTYKKNKWEVEVKILSVQESSYDILVSGRGHRYHMIVGIHTYGCYLCLPSMGIGCELSSYFGDSFWNQESISRYLEESEAATIVAAIKELPQLVS